MPEIPEIVLVRAGGRIESSSALFGAGKKEPHPDWRCPHNWRTILCDYDGGYDIVECSSCGFQSVAKCNFDKEYS